MRTSSSESADERRGQFARFGASVVGFFDSIGKVVGAIAGIIALATTLGFLTLTGENDEAKTTVTPVSFASADLAPVINERFAFSFSHPRTWDREDAFNADGAAFHAPDKSAELRAFGANAFDGPVDVLERVDYLAARQKQAVLDGGGQVLSGDLRFVAWDGPESDRTPASRIVYRSRHTDTGEPVTTIAMLTSQEGRDVTIQCQVASRRFRAYVGACNQLLATLRLGVLAQPPDK